MVGAFGKPGIEPRWSHGDKDGAGTAYNSSSQIWYTIWNGILTEIYYPTVDTPQTRDVQFLITDGSSVFHEEKVDLGHETSKLNGSGPAYRLLSTDKEGRYKIEKEIIGDPHTSVLLQHTKVSGTESFLKKMRLYVLCAPHLDVGGWSNNGSIIEVSGRKILLAEKNGTYLAITATIPFKKTSCGFVGSSDGWTDISANYEMTYEFDSAEGGNIALTGELDLESGLDFVLGISMGNSMHSAVTRLFQSLTMDFKESLKRFNSQWQRAIDGIVPIESKSGDGGELYRSSYGVIMTHEDKTFEGSLVASLSIPWGEVTSDEDRGGYHLVWTRDMYNSATGALAAGNLELPLRALVYLSVAQMDDGSFPQNFWINGTPYWHGIQLDEAAFPIILAWKLREAGALTSFDPYNMVMRAARFIMLHGPITQQERWEESSGYSPSTLASNIAALICASAFARSEGDLSSARYMEEYADFLECHIEDWTVTTIGDLVPGISKHYIRILPSTFTEGMPFEDPNSGVLHINNISPDKQADFPARSVVDGGFLELVRYGIRSPEDPVILDSVKVIDKILKVDTPYGPVWHRYNHDGYGQRGDGRAFQAWGTGRAWPLLTGERGHYEIAAGRSPTPFIEAMEKFASVTRLLPEQVWDTADMPERHMKLGRATGSARPLVWAHAEYIKLLRSAYDGSVFDKVDIVEERYIKNRKNCKSFEIWKWNRKVESVRSGYTLRIQSRRKFTLHWSWDLWKTVNDTLANDPPIGMYFLDFDTSGLKGSKLIFTFKWLEQDKWEGRDFTVSVL